MSLLTRWDPTQDLQEFEKRLSSWMGRPSLAKDRDKESMRVMDWAPLVDITEDDKEYMIKADLPEIKKEDVKISVHDVKKEFYFGCFGGLKNAITGKIWIKSFSTRKKLSR